MAKLNYDNLMNEKIALRKQSNVQTEEISKNDTTPKTDIPLEAPVMPQNEVKKSKPNKDTINKKNNENKAINENKSKIVLPKKNKKTDYRIHSIYIDEPTYQKVKSMGEVNGLSVSETICEILHQVI